MIQHVQDSNDSLATPGGVSRAVQLVCTVHPAEALTRRFVWFTVQPYTKTLATDTWFSKGELRFILRETQVGLFSFYWGNEKASVINDMPKVSNRPVAGGAAPVIRIESGTGTGAGNYIDVPAYEFNIECDKVELWSMLKGASAGMAWTGFLEIVSQMP